MKFRAAFALSAVFVSTVVIACGPPPNKNVAKKVGTEAKGGDNAPTALTDVQFEESPAGGDPAVVGCADGQREGFADIAKFPTIAGCLGVWEGKATLRKGQTSKACGDDLDVCSSPADVCAQGWHVCARDGDYHDLSDRVDEAQCAQGAGPGKFVAAISHVKKKKECAPPPAPTTRYPCLDTGWGAEPVCCGQGCKFGTCRDTVWVGKTRISLGTSEGCGAVTSERNGGILCCKDADAPTPGDTPTGDTPTGDTPADEAAPADGAAPAEAAEAPAEAQN
jgi:hypothetical protein